MRGTTQALCGRLGGLIAFVVLLPFTGEAKDFSYCPLFTSSHATVSGFQDLGNGYVSYAHGYGELEYGSSSELIVEACSSGRKISGLVYACKFSADTGCKTTIDHRDVAQNVLEGAMNPSTSITFEQLAERLALVVPGTEMADLDERDGESCACHVAYPKLRGRKAKYVYYSEY